MKILKHLKKSSLPYILSVGLLTSSFISGCKREISDIFIEDANVIYKQYNPKSSSIINFGIFGCRTTDNPERYLIKFDGKIDFMLDNKEIYDQFKEGDIVEVSYINNSGFGKWFYPYKFIDVKLKK